MANYYCTEIVLEVRAFIGVEAENWEEAKVAAAQKLEHAEIPYSPTIIEVRKVGGDYDE